MEDGWNLVHCPEQGGAEHFVTEENEFTPRKSSLYPAESSSKPSEMPDDTFLFIAIQVDVGSSFPICVL